VQRPLVAAAAEPVELLESLQRVAARQVRALLRPVSAEVEHT